MRNTRLPAAIVVAAGVSAALHVGKLPPAIPVLRDALGVTLVEAGFLLSLVQLAGMLLGLAVGLLADSAGLRRSVLAGLIMLALASGLGGFVQDASQLLVLRALEGVGLLLAAMPAPGLIRRLVPPGQVDAALGWWGAYMPLGTALALLCGPLVMEQLGWPGWWWMLGGVSLAAALAVWRMVPADPPASATQGTAGWLQRLHRTLTSAGPWLVALTFAMYSSQWLAVIGFLPSMYAQAGVAAHTTALLTALVAAVNMAGNIGSGRLLQRGVRAERLLTVGFVAMGLGAWVAFSAFGGQPLPLPVRFGALLVFSMVGGLIPGTLFSLAVRFAPGEGTASTTVGWMQQCSALGQFAGPPLVAWMAIQTGGWEWTWVVTGAAAVAGLVLARLCGKQ
jgi:CP family cyanate transporter-like MFS transporter